MDGVILDFTEAKIMAAKAAGFYIRPEETHSEIIKRLIPDDILEKIKKEIYSGKEYGALVRLMDGSRAALDLLKENGIRYFLVSKRKNPDAAIETMKRHGLWPEYFNTESAHFVIHAEGKDEKAKNCGINHFLDDELSVLEKLSSVSNRILFDKYGALKEISPYPSVSSWQEFIQKLII